MFSSMENVFNYLYTLSEMQIYIGVASGKLSKIVDST